MKMQTIHLQKKNHNNPSCAAEKVAVSVTSSALLSSKQIWVLLLSADVFFITNCTYQATYGGKK